MNNLKPHLNIIIESNSLELDVKKVLQIIRPNWREDDIKFKGTKRAADSGLLNVMCVCYIDDVDMKDAVMCRVYRDYNKFNEFLSRQHEANIMQIVHDRYGFAPNVLATLNNGFCYEYIKGEVMSPTSVKFQDNWKLIAKQLALLHSTKPNDEMQHKSKFQDFYDSLIPSFPESLPNPEDNNRLKNCLPTKSALLEEYNEVMKKVSSVGSNYVFCHGDTRPENMVWDKDSGKIMFVDWELSGIGSQAFEIGYHFMRCAGMNLKTFTNIPDETFQLNWLHVYLETYLSVVRPNTTVTDFDVRKLYVQEQVHLLLIILQTAGAIASQDQFDGVPIDLLSVSIARYEHYLQLKDQILALKLPTE